MSAVGRGSRPVVLQVLKGSGPATAPPVRSALLPGSHHGGGTRIPEAVAAREYAARFLMQA